MEKQRRIGLLCSVLSECDDIISHMQRMRRVGGGLPDILSGEVDDKPVALTISGVGKVNASHACTVLIERYRPHCIINFGVGGCYPGTNLSLGDVAVAEKEIYADEGVLTSEGFYGMEKINIPVFRKRGKKFFNEFSADRIMLNRFKRIAKRVPFQVKFGNFLTVSTVTGTLNRAKYLRDRFGSVCENMEGASVFHISHMYGIPCFELRGVSNVVENRNTEKWEIDKAALNCQFVVREFLRNL